MTPETEGRDAWLVRPARLTDRDVLLGWRNDTSAYQWYSNPRPVTDAEHDRWLDERLARPLPCLWLLEIDGEPAGMARLDVEDADGPRPVGVVSVVVAAAARGRGVGSALLRSLDEQAAALGVHRLRAVVHSGNTASRALFLAAGYQREHAGPAPFEVYAKP